MSRWEKGFVIVMISGLLLGCAGPSVTERAIRQEAKRLQLDLGSLVNTTQFELPEQFDLRWTIYEEFAKDIELDLTSHRGKTVTTYLYDIPSHALKDRLMESNPEVTLQAAIWVDGDQVIGGLLFPPGTAGIGYSLSGRTLEEITGESYSQWTQQVMGGYSHVHSSPICCL